MTKNNKILTAVVVVVLVIAVVWLIMGNSNQGGTAQPTAGTGTSVSPNPGTPGGAPLGTNNPPGAGVPTSPNVSYLVLSPKLGDQWILEQPHLISWNKPSGVTGAVYLVDAFTNTITGWINSGTGEKATSTSWDTKHIALTRNGGPQKIVGRGTYFIKVTFDRNQGSIRSNAFSLITPDEVTHNTYQVSLNQLALSPTTVTAKNGDTIVFVNDDDTITYQIASPDIFGPFKLMPGQSAALVLNLKPGTYPYSDQSHAGITGKIVVIP
jgi:plastocyanin